LGLVAFFAVAFDFAAGFRADPLRAWLFRFGRARPVFLPAAF
jgi:hypothetical protein